MTMTHERTLDELLATYPASAAAAQEAAEIQRQHHQLLLSLKEGLTQQAVSQGKIPPVGASGQYIYTKGDHTKGTHDATLEDYEVEIETRRVTRFYIRLKHFQGRRMWVTPNEFEVSHAE